LKKPYHERRIIVVTENQDLEQQLFLPLNVGVSFEQALDMKVKDLALIDCSVDINTSVREVARIYELHQEWPGVIIISGDRFFGMLSRQICFEVLGKPFGLEVYSRRTMYEFCTTINIPSLVIEGNTSIPEAVKQALVREKQNIFDPLVIQLDGKKYKLLNMHVLLLAQCDVLENLSDEFRQLSVIDPLTQLNNRRGFFESAQPEVVRIREDQNDLSALMIDIDNFKKTNDLYGHFIGNHVLRAVADEIRQTLRQTDLLGRYGGEEFIGLLPNTSIDAACVIAERLRDSVENRIIEINDYRVSVTVSIGISHLGAADGSLDVLLSQADQAMYWAKASGRNRINIWSKEQPHTDAIELLRKGLKIRSAKNTNNNLAKVYDETIEGWARAVEMRDKEMQGHARRVVDLTLALAVKCGIKDKKLEDIRRGALLHDIGKIAIPDPILFKPGKLSEDEWKIMRMHPIYAFEFLKPIAFLKNCMDIPYCHHEHWDGSGYPRGIEGDDIPMAARIFTVIDVWDALCTDRCYRPAWSQKEAREYIQSQAGKLFDPQIVERFLELLDDPLVFENITEINGQNVATES